DVGARVARQMAQRGDAVMLSAKNRHPQHLRRPLPNLLQQLVERRARPWVRRQTRIHGPDRPISLTSLMANECSRRRHDVLPRFVSYWVIADAPRPTGRGTRSETRARTKRARE